MNVQRLRLLLELSRRGSMRAVAEALGYTTSTVSQQLALLAREAGTPLLEPHGRNVRLTPAGRRLAGHAVTVLAALDAARADLDPAAAPAGVVRVGGFATAIRRSIVPAVERLGREHPDVRLRVLEFEPAEAFAALDADTVDLALVYDYDLAPLSFDRALHHVGLWNAEWHLAVPAARAQRRPVESAEAFEPFAETDWIVNSRNTADEQVVRTIASLAGFEPQIAHRVDGLELVEDLVRAGLGVALLPADHPPSDGVALVPLRHPAATLRAYAVTRRGSERWPPLALVLRLLAAG